jgi:hypothetical protein
VGFNMIAPKPPIKNMTDFVVFCFVSIVAIILVTAVFGVLLDAVLRPNNDRSTVVNALADITTTLIGALVGFIAGKGSGHAEAREEQQAEQRETIRQLKAGHDDTA